MDARPSDAIALALRSSAPIYLKNELAENMLSISELIDEETQKELDKMFNVNTMKKALH
jgi:bifunctional DNase/RNase